MSKTSAPGSTAPAPPTIRIALPNGWARSGLAGIEAALIGWGLVMVPTLVGYLSVAGNPWLGKATWADATAVGGDLWGATLAAPVHAGGAILWAVPTLMTVLVVVLLRVLLLGGRGYPPAAQWMAVPTFAVTALALVGATAGNVSLLQAVPGALAVPALAALWAVVSQTTEAPAWTGRAAWVWEGLRQARVVLGVLALVGAVAVGVSLHASWEQVRGIHELLLAGTTDTVVTVIAQVLFAPTAIAWALSWLAGPGFWVGADTLHAPGTAPVAPIPAIPLLGAVPATAPGDRVALVLVGVGVLVGIWLRWRHRAEDVRTQALAGAVCAGGVAVVMLAWFALATLHLGEGRMSLLGPRVAWSVAMVVVEVVVTAQVVALASHPVTVAWVRAWTGVRVGELRSRLAERRSRLAERRVAAGAGEEPEAGAVAGAAAGAATGTGGVPPATTDPNSSRTGSASLPDSGEDSASGTARRVNRSTSEDPDGTPTVALDIRASSPAEGATGPESAPESEPDPADRADPEETP
ncbi:MAG: cell division protein PerM [Pauljensenia sp.]